VCDAIETGIELSETRVRDSQVPSKVHPQLAAA
jgi:hypothetical protein